MPSESQEESIQNECSCIPKKKKKKDKVDSNVDMDSIPPPPPGGELEWDLQFCRWWGWNWVRRKPEDLMLNPRSQYEPLHCRFMYPYGPEREGICICKKIKDCCKSKCCKPKKNKYCPCPFPQQHPDACRYYSNDMYMRPDYQFPQNGVCRDVYRMDPYSCPRRMYRDDFRQEDDPRYRDYRYGPEGRRGPPDQYYRTKYRPSIRQCCKCCKCPTQGSSQNLDDDFDRVSVSLHEKNKTRHYVCHPSSAPNQNVENRGYQEKDHSSNNTCTKPNIQTVQNLHDLCYHYNPYLSHLGVPSFHKCGPPTKTFPWMEQPFANDSYRDEFISPVTGKTYSLNLVHLNKDHLPRTLPNPIDPKQVNFDKVFEVTENLASMKKNLLYDNVLNCLSQKTPFGAFTFKNINPVDNIFEDESIQVTPRHEDNNLLSDVRKNLRRVDVLMKNLTDRESDISNPNNSDYSSVDCDKIIRKISYNSLEDIQSSDDIGIHTGARSKYCKNATIQIDIQDSGNSSCKVSGRSSKRALSQSSIENVHNKKIKTFNEQFSYSEHCNPKIGKPTKSDKLRSMNMAIYPDRFNKQRNYAYYVEDHNNITNYKHSIHSATTCEKNETAEESPHGNTFSESNNLEMNESSDCTPGTMKPLILKKLRN